MNHEDLVGLAAHAGHWLLGGTLLPRERVAGMLAQEGWQGAAACYLYAAVVTAWLAAQLYAAKKSLSLGWAGARASGRLAARLVRGRPDPLMEAVTRALADPHAQIEGERDKKGGYAPECVLAAGGMEFLLDVLSHGGVHAVKLACPVGGKDDILQSLSPLERERVTDLARAAVARARERDRLARRAECLAKIRGRA